MGKRRKLAETIKWVEKELKHFENTLQFESKQVIIGNLMNAYMGIGNLAKADEIWDSMFNKQSKAIRRDIFADLHFFRLFSLLNSKRFELLNSASESALRYFRKFEDAKTIFEVEIPIALLLQKQHNYKKKEIFRELMEQIRAIVQNFISNLPGIDNFQEHYTRYVIWCDAIINEQPFYLAAADWYEQYKKTNS